MEFENLRDGSESRQTESTVNSWFRSPGDEELRIRDLVHIAREDRQDGGCRFFILALVKGIDDDESRDVGGFEWVNNNLLHLGNQGLFPNIRVHSQDLNQFLSETRVLIGELEGECWKDHAKVASVLEVSRTEEAGTEPFIHKTRLRKCLGDGCLSRPGEAVQPEYALISLVRQPMLDLRENVLPRSPQTSFPVPGTVPSVRSPGQTVEKDEVSRFLSTGYFTPTESQVAGLTMSRKFFS